MDGAIESGRPTRGNPQPGERIGPYQVTRFVARGGMASVLEVIDTRSSTPCALKLLLPVQEAAQAKTRFRREFRALSRLQHPNVLRVHEWGLYGDRPWFTMELLDGSSLKAEVATWSELPPDTRFRRAQSILVQISRALAYIHDRGLVHRDVTPGNIMVSPEGSAKLMDFGVVKDHGADLTGVGELVGTVSYIAPEQIAGDSVDPRTDLYSLGAVLYLMLTGRRPFSARTLHGYLEKHLREAVRPPREVDPMVPTHLDAICVRLLSKAPSERYASATHLLHVLGDEADESEQESWPPLVGRTPITARLRETIEGVESGKPGHVVLLSGLAGQGKTRLGDYAEAYARRLGVTTARGHCRPHDRPFGAFVGVYRDLIPDAPPAVLQAAFAGEDDGLVRERYPVNAAFRELVVASTPCVIIIDDLEQADPATVELLEYLVRNTLSLASDSVAFVLLQEAADGGHTSAGQRVLAVGETTAATVGPLEPAAVEELVLSVLPHTDSALGLARRLHMESGGSPAFITDMLRGLIDEGILIQNDGRYQLALDASEITRSRLPMPASLRQALKERIAPLSEDVLVVARTIALARHPLDLDALVACVPRSEDTVMDALDALEEADIVESRRTGESEEVSLSHQRFQDVLLEPLYEDQLHDMHRTMGEVLERQHRYEPGRIVEDLAYHFERGGVPPKAYNYLVMTAIRHLRQSLYEESLDFLERALVMEPVARPQTLLDDADSRLAEVYLARSQARYHIGQWSRAVDDARRAEQLAIEVRAPDLHSRIAAELGLQLRNRGEAADSERALRVALYQARVAGKQRLRTMPLYELGALLWMRGELEGAERRWRESLEIAQQTNDERALGFGYNGLGILAICKGESMEARRHLEQSAGLFERLGMLGPLAISRVNLVELYLSIGLLRKALALADRTVSQAREVNHPHGIALGLAYRAQVLIEMGRQTDARTNATEALRLVRSLGNADDEVVALATTIRVELEVGNSEAALARFTELSPLLEEHDSEGIAPQVHAWQALALAQLDRADEAREVLSRSDETRQWPNLRVRIHIARGRAWLALGAHAEAAEVLLSALEVAEGSGYRFFQLMAHHLLVQCIDDPVALQRHQRVADSLARSLAASLPTDDAERFLSRGWGRITVPE